METGSRIPTKRKAVRFVHAGVAGTMGPLRLQLVLSDVAYLVTDTRGCVIVGLNDSILHLRLVYVDLPMDRCRPSASPDRGRGRSHRTGI